MKQEKTIRCFLFLIITALCICFTIVFAFDAVYVVKARLNQSAEVFGAYFIEITDDSLADSDSGLETGDLAVFKATDGPFKSGDLICYDSGGSLTLGTVTSVTNSYLLSVENTAGTDNQTIEADTIAAKFTYNLPKMSGYADFLQSYYGIAYMIALAVLFIVFYLRFFIRKKHRDVFTSVTMVNMELDRKRSGMKVQSTVRPEDLPGGIYVDSESDSSDDSLTVVETEDAPDEKKHVTDIGDYVIRPEEGGTPELIVEQPEETVLPPEKSGRQNSRADGMGFGNYVKYLDEDLVENGSGINEFTDDDDDELEDIPLYHIEGIKATHYKAVKKDKDNL